jgi:hypothetical protein
MKITIKMPLRWDVLVLVSITFEFMFFTGGFNAWYHRQKTVKQ